MKLLVIEDDVTLSKMLRTTLSSIGNVEVANSGEEGMEKINASYFDLLIVDLMLPGIQGDEIIKEVRKKFTMPIIVLSAISDIDKKINCLNKGADDYVEKPFSREEFLARVEAALRRSNKNFEAFGYNYNNMTVNFTNKMVIIEDKRVEMDRKTYEILELLVRNKELIMTKQQIYDRIWGYYSDTVQTVVEINIFRLRKILSVFALDQNLKTIKSTGYMWTEKEVANGAL